MFKSLHCAARRMHPLSTLLKTLPASIASQSFLRPGIFAIMLGAITLFASSPSSGSTSVTDIDGNVYNTVTIGTQVWMKENLKVTKYRNGEVIGTTTSLDISGETSPKYQWGSEGGSYGRWYTWYAATDSRGACPTGWHLPTDAEWTTLTNYLGGESVAGGKMKLTGTTYWNSPNTGADNSSGWSGLPGGYHYYNNSHFLDRQGGYWWSATGYDKTRAWFRALSSSFASVERVNQGKSLGYSVRCVNGDDVGVGKLGVVNTTGDESDANNSDGICDVDLNTEGEQCTLRAAIEEVNLSTDVNTITFDIPTTDPGYNAGTSTFTISPGNALPGIEKAVVVDATSQPNGTVVLNGVNAGMASGISTKDKECTIKGMHIQNFSSDGINAESGIFLKNIKVSSNKGSGVSSSADITIEGTDNEFSDNVKSGISGRNVSAGVIQVENNGGYGIAAKEGVFINGMGSGDFNTIPYPGQTSRISNNSLGGIRSAGEGLEGANVGGSYLEVVGNGQSADVDAGHGIYAYMGRVSLNFSKVNKNKGGGISATVGDVHINGTGNEVSENGIGIWKSGISGRNVYAGVIQVENNGGYGIAAKEGVFINGMGSNDFNTIPYPGQISRISNNSLGGIRSAGEESVEGADIGGSYLEVMDNGQSADVDAGHGIYAYMGHVSLNFSKVNKNKGGGISATVGDVHINGTGNEVSENGIGIWKSGISGQNVSAGVIQVENNGGYGIAAKGDVSINVLTQYEGGPRIAHYTDRSKIGNNGNDGILAKKDLSGSEGGSVAAFYLDVINNKGAGIQAESDLTLNDSYICGNAGMNLVVVGTKNLTNVTVCTPVISPPVMGDVPNQSGAVGTAFSLNLAGYVTLTDGDAITGYAIASGGLPSGLNLNTANGLIDGTPTTAGTYNVTVTASDNDGASNADAIQFTVAAAPFNDTYTGPSPTGTGNITAGFSGGGAGCNFTVSQYIPVTGHAASPPAGSAPAGVSFPKGLFDFTTGGCTVGSTITMTITYPQALPAGTQYWKYGPTPTDASYHWYVLPATISGNIVTFTIADGGLGDDDLAVNGTIVDQGGPGVQMAQATPTAIPTLSEWGMALLMCVLGLFGAGAVRRRSKVGM